MKNNFTLGKGIAVAGKWIAIAIMIVSLLNFIDNRLDDCKYEYERSVVIEKPNPQEEIPGTTINEEMIRSSLVEDEQNYINR